MFIFVHIRVTEPKNLELTSLPLHFKQIESFTTSKRRLKTLLSVRLSHPLALPSLIYLLTYLFKLGRYYGAPINLNGGGTFLNLSSQFISP